MSNPFKDINKKDAIISLQQQSGDKIVAKKQGRPARPNMKRYLIKMDEVLHGKVAKEAEKLGTSNSFIIGQAVRSYIQKKEKDQLVII